jgi:NADH:ubiquinone oxidoreductase subunit 6 (subunit J)
MFLFADPIIDGSAIWKIIVVALVGGVGVVVVFGFLLLGLKLADTSDGETSKLTGYVLSALCGAAIIAVIVLGIWAMTKKS